jgi:hypothetical protein
MIPAHQLCGCFSHYSGCCDSDNSWLAICGFVALADSRDSNPFYGFYSSQGQYCPATCRHREQNSSEKLTAEIITSRPVFIAQKAAFYYFECAGGQLEMLSSAKQQPAIPDWPPKRNIQHTPATAPPKGVFHQ